MKNIAIIGCLALLGLFSSLGNIQAQSDAISLHFSDYMEREDYRTVYITKRMFQLVGQVAEGSEDKALEEAVKKLEGLRSLSSQQNGTALYNTFAKRVPKDFEELLVVQEGREKTCFWVKENAQGQIKELFMLSSSEDEIVVVSIYGVVDLKQIAKLSRKMDIGGLDKLDSSED